MKKNEDIEVLGVNEPNKQNSKKEEKKKNALIIALIMIAILLVVVLKVATDKKQNQTVDIDAIINEKKTTVLFIKNSDSKKCKNCQAIEKILKEQKISYQSYDINKVSEEDYKTFLNKLSINQKVFGYPAVIYLKDGKMYSNIINIEDSKIVNQFIKDYDLTKMK